MSIIMKQGLDPAKKSTRKELKLIITILSIRRRNLFVDQCGRPCKGYELPLKENKRLFRFFFFFFLFFLFTLKPYLAMTVLKVE